MKKRILSFFFALVFLFAAGCAEPTLRESSDILSVHFIDVGQGDSIFIELPGGQCMLIDSGEKQYSETVKSYISTLKYEKIDYLVATHPHSDHIGSMSEIVDAFDIDTVYMPKVSHNTKTYENLLLSIKNKGLRVTTAKAGVSVRLTDDLDFEIVAPVGETHSDLNNWSVVLRLVYGNTAFLFTGDAEAASESKITANISADVLKVGHHGSYTSTSADFLKNVAPNHAVISCGKDNDYGHPHKETLEKLTNAGVAVYRTDLSGSIIFTSDGITVSTDAKTSETVAAAAEYIGNKNSKKFHLITCSGLPAEKNCVSFATRNDAISAGYSPCGICKP